MYLWFLLSQSTFHNLQLVFIFKTAGTIHVIFFCIIVEQSVIFLCMRLCAWRMCSEKCPTVGGQINSKLL